MSHRPHQSISRVQVKPEWLGLLETELAQNPRSTVYSLATVHEGAPRVRSVVHRSFSPSGLLLSTTDLRMPKASQLAADSRTEISWLLPTLVQFRVTGRAYIVPASGPSGGTLSRKGSQLRISPGYSSPRNPPPLRRSGSSATGSSATGATSPTSSATLSPHATPPLATEEARGDDAAATRASVSSTSSAPAATDQAASDPAPSSGTASASLSRSGSASGRPRLHLTPTPADLASDRPSSPIIKAPRSPRGSPPLSASSSSSYPQFHLRPNVALNPSVSLGASDSDINLPSLAGTLSALVSWGVSSQAPESSKSWWEAERTRIWDSLSPALRATYGRPAPPGSTLADAPDPGTWVTRMEAYAKGPEEAKGLTEAWENFAVVALAPERVEMLELMCEPHRRVCWVRDGDSWAKEELVP